MSVRNQKVVAVLMLAMLLPATVLAASLRYCAGENGHRGIEFAHVKNFHATPGMNGNAPSLDVALEILHLAGPHCQDRLLLPEAAKPEACHSRLPRPEPVIGPISRSQINARPERRVGSARRLTASLQLPDPRLVSIRTIVLRN
jgi:hypothetical protein